MVRIGVESAVTVLGDALKPGSFPDMEVDLVLVDPPCTGTGTFNRIPSGKWHLSRRSIDRMASIQRRTRAKRLYPHLHGCNGFYLARLEKALD